MIKTYKPYRDIGAKLVMASLLVINILILLKKEWTLFLICLSSALILMSFYMILNRVKVLRNKDMTINSILRMSQATLNADSKEDLYRTILEEMVDAIESADKASLITIDALGFMNFEAVVGFDLEAAKELNMRFEESFLFNAITDKIPKSIIIDDIELKNQNLLSEESKEIMSRVGIGAIDKTVCVPITLDKKIFGMINIDNTSGKVFSEEDVKLIEDFAVEISKIVKLHELLNKTTAKYVEDPLTKAFVRASFKEKAEEILKEETLVEKKLVYFDIDKLKSINKDYGFEVGDQILIHFVKGIKSQIYGKEMIARYGGDEFVMLFTRRNSSLESFMDRCVKWFEDHPYKHKGEDIFVEFSYGTAIYGSDARSLGDLILLANERMESKQEHKLSDA
ncbi:diguanylate cyclase [Acidaminobacter sp. JC074]|uniref:sensor domain-containing diguanylate cyclase n=1 Tax=Acidaminobacter sp. JC074 TaxID=2530199 RepID=UPI001F0EA51A|nr:sensor domain-containing diguanylate cyclase [Acidaminobacter sp. JC074]MCH4886527.1 diguanylate cyclase [Acidaminobacter sp. JC074]